MAIISGTNSSETKTGTALGDVISGYAGNDILSGFGGSDILDGGQGNDTVLGGAGDDVLFGGAGIYGPGYYGALGTVSGFAGNDILNGGAGIDQVSYAHGWANKSVTVDLAAGTAVTTTGQDTLISIENVTGSLFDDTLLGNGGANNLNGFGGNDNVNGRGGNDTLSGSSGNDTLLGSGGHDSLLGDGGRDNLNGGSGNDTLWGGSEKDIYTGGAGADRFVFDFYDLVIGAERNIVTDFSHAQGDKVDVSLIDADTTNIFVDQFTFEGTKAFTGPAQLRYVHEGGNTLVLGNTDADAAPEMVIQFNGLINFVASDFIL